MSPLVSPLRDILPLLVGSGVAIAFVTLVVKQSESGKIPYVAKKVNELGAVIASCIAIIVALLALWYVGSQTIVSLISASYKLLIFAFILLFVAFIVPAIFNAIPSLWVRTFYTQFDAAQSKDIEEAKKAIVKTEDGGKTTTE